MKKRPSISLSKGQLMEHDLRNSFHAIKLGLSQVRKTNDFEYIQLLLDEINQLEDNLMENSISPEVYSVKEISAYIKLFLERSYPSEDWKSFFKFVLEEKDEGKTKLLKVKNLKLILRNLSINILESGTKDVVVKTCIDKSSNFCLEVKNSKVLGETEKKTHGIGLFSIKQNMQENNGEMEISNCNEFFTIILKFPLVEKGKFSQSFYQAG